MDEKFYTALEIMRELSPEEMQQVCLLMVGMKANDFGPNKAVEFLKKTSTQKETH